MTKRSAPIILLVLLIIPRSLAQEQKDILHKFSLQNAEVDTSLADAVRSAFEDDDGQPLKAISIDLNGDGVKEKLVPNEFLSGNGVCPWVLYEPKTRSIIGRIMANEIFVLKRKTNRSYVLQCSWSGDGDYKLTNFVFDGNEYVAQ